MSLRQMFQGSIVKPGFNPLGTQTTTTTYFPYLYSWGSGSGGALGLSSTTNYSSPVQVGSLYTWSKVKAAYNSVAAIKTDGTLWTWGYNGYGQLGLGNTSSYSSPKQVGSLTNWNTVSSGRYHFIFTKM